jgi:CheY-like chemotaxis protein
MQSVLSSSTFSTSSPTNTSVSGVSHGAPTARGIDALSGCPKILLAEDPSGKQRFAIAVLEKMGYQVFHVENADSAVVATESEHFDLLLMDIQMAGCFEAIAKIRRRDTRFNTHTPIIATTSHSHHEYQQKCQALDVDGLVPEPIRMDTLKKMMDELLPHSSDGVSSDSSSSPTGPTLAANLNVRQLGEDSSKCITGHEVQVGAKSSDSTTKPLILLAEDNLVNQIVAIKLLEKLGYAITVVGNGKEAVTACRRSRYDLILMDVQMPEMGGFEATAIIREMEHMGEKEYCPILAMTAHAIQGYREKCLEAGMDGYISKPIVVQHLKETLHDFISRERQRRMIPQESALAEIATPPAAAVKRTTTTTTTTTYNETTTVSKTQGIPGETPLRIQRMQLMESIPRTDMRPLITEKHQTVTPSSVHRLVIPLAVMLVLVLITAKVVSSQL